MLQYDDSAFHFFALSVLGCGLVPGWYSIITEISPALIRSISVVSCTSEEEKERNIEENKGSCRLKRKATITSLILTVSGTILFAYIYFFLINEGEEIRSFDPYQILGLEPTADLEEIKKSFRKLSRLFHPDKCHDLHCEPKFILIKKAYDALADPVARECYEKYGNPDCDKTLDISWGLPSFLIEATNRNIVLMAYLIVFVGVIPFFAWRYFTESARFGEKGIMYDTYAWYHHTLNLSKSVKSLPEIMAGSAEFRQVNMPNENEKAEISCVMDSLRSRMQKPKYNHPVCVAGNVLIHAHLLRQTDNLSLKAKETLVNMLNRSSGLIEAMITVCRHQDSVHEAMNCIKFGQCIAQALWTGDNTLLQLPHFSENEINHCKKGNPSARANNIDEYIQVPDGEKKGLVDFSEQQQRDVHECCRLIPNLSVETRVFVDDDDDCRVFEGDLCTARVTLTRKNLRIGEKAGLVHAPRFPLPLKEAWWIILASSSGRIITIDKVTDPNRVLHHDIKFLAPEPGQYEFDLYVMSNGYAGLDHTKKLTLRTLDASILPKYKVHPDDVELDDEPTLFEQIMNTDVEEDSDSDLDDSDSEEGE